MVFPIVHDRVGANDILLSCLCHVVRVRVGVNGT
jgi:hypothetical protein